MPKGGKGKGKKGKGKKKEAAGPSRLILPQAIRDAANAGELEIVTGWLEGGGHVDATHSSPAYPDRYRTLLMIASRKGMASFVVYLLQRGAAVNRQDDNGCTALMFAALHGKPFVVQELLLRGADATLCNSLGQTALQWAKEHGHDDCLRLIQQRLLRDERLGVEERLLIHAGWSSPRPVSPPVAKTAGPGIWAGV